jgi:hypothetical protein
MKFKEDRPLPTPEASERKLLELANAVETDHAGRLDVIAEAFSIFLKCPLRFFMVGDYLLRLPHSERVALSSRQVGTGAFLVLGHFFALTELDSEAPSFRCLSNLMLQVVRPVVAAKLA